jgi:hypothetical protein
MTEFLPPGTTEEEFEAPNTSGTLNLMSWSNREEKRKERQLEEW